MKEKEREIGTETDTEPAATRMRQCFKIERKSSRVASTAVAAVANNRVGYWKDRNTTSSATLYPSASQE